MIIAIDGPAGSGKSSTARAVARRLGFHHLESGAFYRALTYAALQKGLPVEQWPALTAGDLDALNVRARPADGSFRLFVGAEDVTAALRSPDITTHVSHMAQIPAVRTWLLEQLRDAGRRTDLVCDGRDMGTVVFPEAELKIFLTATPETRARRRLAEHGLADPDAAQLADEVARLLARDRLDTEREVAPLRRAADAVLLDTTALDFEAQVEAVVRLAEARRGGGVSPR